MVIKNDIPYNTSDYELSPMIRKEGFREYDARWLFEKEINLLGLQYLGAAIATHLHHQGHTSPQIVVGHDYRAYSASVKYALITGLLSAGAEIFDIGLAVTPMAYFAQQYLKVKGLAMVTASHNENGWTGVKIASGYPETYGPELMSELGKVVFSRDYIKSPGKYKFIPSISEAYIKDIVKDRRLQKKIQAVVATGNGTSGLYAPKILELIGCNVMPVHTNLDWNFPNYNPNPENMDFLESIKRKVKSNGADIGFGFDGDGDRIGIIDDQGNEFFSDKIGLLVARYLTNQYSNFHIVVDVKSTALFSLDQVLKSKGVTTEYWITGHSYMKSRVLKTSSLAGFEKSGHFFFSPPLGHGYDDGNLSAVVICEMLDKTKKSLSELRRELTKTWQSPTMAPYCSENQKYKVIAKLQRIYKREMINKRKICGHHIRSINTINGVRVEYDDNSWSLIRASSNKPSLVVVIESLTGEKHMHEIFDDINHRLQNIGGVGEYDQILPPLLQQ